MSSVSGPLIFIAVLTIATLFSLTLTVVVLRFLNVLAQIKRSESFDRSELLRELDQSHVAAFNNAMSALGTVQERIYAGQIEMFNKTMDMIHGPQQTEQAGGQYATDDPRVGMAQSWGDPSTDAGDYAVLFRDPTDDSEPDLNFAANLDDGNGYAVSVQPGETLLPPGAQHG